MLADAAYWSAPAEDDDVVLTVKERHSFRKMESIEFLWDNDWHNRTDPRMHMRRLTALRDTMGTFSRNIGGYIDRATFLEVLEAQDTTLADPVVGYGTDHGYVDGKAFLIDAVMELDVTAEEKLRFIFDTLDTDRVGTISVDQVVRLLDAKFATAKLEMVGLDMKSVAVLLFFFSALIVMRWRNEVHGEINNTLSNNLNRAEA